ncbi:MAG: hypothetical protein KGS61_12100, partial [Verrucomicrobia bacterium]|nr:hypothetical protein [Verrucomicrobiota bacterium]
MAGGAGQMGINYYSDPHVRARMLEFAGGGCADRLTCRFLTSADLTGARGCVRRRPAELARLWDEGGELHRSLWDRKALIAHLGVEYVNFDSPAEPYLDPERVLHLIHHVDWAVEAVLLDYGIRPLHLLVGPAHHFVWRVRRASPVFAELASLGRPAVPSQRRYSPPRTRGLDEVAAEWAAAHVGLGRVVEYVAHRVRELAELVGEVPAELSVTESGPARHEPEGVSIDLSAYSDPLHGRTLCLPFSLYLQPWRRGLLNCGTDPARLRPMFAVPVLGMQPREGLEIPRDPARVLSLARHAETRIPDQSKGTEHLLAAYRESDWYGFHAWFYS